MRTQRTHCLSIARAPDLAALRRVHALPASLADFEVVEYALQKSRAHDGPDSLPSYLQQIEAIAWLTHGPEGLHWHEAQASEAGERALIESFFATIATDDLLVSWQPGELQALLQRALLTGACLSHESAGVKCQSLAAMLGITPAALDDLACLSQLPALTGVQEASAHCAQQAVRIALLWLRYQRTTGLMDQRTLTEALHTVQVLSAAHWPDFLATWPA